MKKKIIAGLICCAFVANANAASTLCNYIDVFHLNASVDNQIFISDMQADENLIIEKIDSRGFQISSTDSCSKGYAQVRVGADDNHFCVLEINDGPYINTPKVTPSCTGMTFLGFKHEGSKVYSIRVSY